MKNILLVFTLMLASLSVHAKGGRYFCNNYGNQAGKIETAGVDEKGNRLYLFYKNANSRNGWLIKLIQQNRDLVKGDLFNADERFRFGEEFYVGTLDNEHPNMRLTINNINLICIREM